MFEERQVHHALPLRHPDPVAEVADRRRGDAAPAQAGDGGHPGVVPAGDRAALHQPGQPPLAQHRVAQVQPGELDLPGDEGRPALRHAPVVERAVVLELQGAERVGDLLDRVGQRVREVVHRVDEPVLAGAVVAQPADAVEGGVAQVQVGRRHVDPGAEHAGAVRELPGAHPPEPVEVLFRRAAAPGALPARRLQRAPGLPDLVRGLVVHIRLAPADQGLGVVVEALEVVGGEPGRPVVAVAQPLHIAGDGVHEERLFLRRIRVVVAEVAGPPVLGGDAEVEHHGLGVADVEVAVRLRGEAGPHPAAVLAGGAVGGDFRPDEVRGRRGGDGRAARCGRRPALGGAHRTSGPPRRSSRTNRSRAGIAIRGRDSASSASPGSSSRFRWST